VARSLRDILFGKRPDGLGGLEQTTQQTGDAIKDLGRTLQGEQPGVRTCPYCHREVKGRSKTCPEGHYVG
jgi:hypothetical protein